MSKKKCTVCHRNKLRFIRALPKGHGKPIGKLDMEPVYRLEGYTKALGLSGRHAHVSCLRALDRKIKKDLAKRGLST